MRPAHSVISVRSLELANTVLCARPESLELLLGAAVVPTIGDTVRSHLAGLQQAMAEGAQPEPGDLQAAAVCSPAAQAALQLVQVNRTWGTLPNPTHKFELQPDLKNQKGSDASSFEANE